VSPRVTDFAQVDEWVRLTQNEAGAEDWASMMDNPASPISVFIFLITSLRQPGGSAS